MSSAPGPVQVLHFSDVLCVWAYVAHRRMEQVRADFGDRVEVAVHFIPVYADVARRIERAGGAEGYAASIQGVGRRFDHVELHPDLFRVDPPTSSNAAHRFLRAVARLEGDGQVAPGAMEALTWAVRQAFFVHGRDISAADTLEALAADAGLPLAAIDAVLRSGAADADLAHDAWLQQQHRVPVSPSIVLDDGRHLLNGNVGYRIIHAHLQEMLQAPPARGSWC